MILEMWERAVIADGWTRAVPLHDIMFESGRSLEVLMAVVRDMGLPDRLPAVDLRQLDGTVVMDSVPGAPGAELRIRAARAGCAVGIRRRKQRRARMRKSPGGANHRGSDVECVGA